MEINLFKYAPCGAIDGLDFHLLGHLCRDPFATHEALAGAIGRSASAVRKRLTRLREDGVLAGFTAYPTPGAFGREGVGAAWDTDVPLERLLAVEDTVYAVNDVEGRVGALAFTRDAARWRVLAEDAVGAPAWQGGVLPARDVPPLGPLEWRVADALVEHPTAALATLADYTGLSPRTVRARRAWLLQHGALVVEPLIRPSRSGALAFHVSARAPREAWPAVQEALGETIAVSDYGESVYLFCRAPDLPSQTARLTAARRVPGVTRLDVVLNRDFVLATDRLHAWIRAELDAWTRAQA